MSAPTSDRAAFRDQRRRILRKTPGLYGLDYAEIAGSEESGRLWRLRLDFVGEPPEEPRPAQFRVLDPDGSTDPALTVVGVAAAPDEENAVELTLRCLDLDMAPTLAEDPRAFSVELIDLPTDRHFTRVRFRFDGGSAGEPAPTRLARRLPPPTEIDYLAKDYESFKSLMLDRISVEAPDWRERSPADLGVTLVELLAYAADYLSYRQDAVATEAYLDTARRRVSVRRHLRLVGHHLHEGCNARVWVQLDADPGAEPCVLPAGTRLLTHAGQLPTSESRPEGGQAFEIAGHQPTVMRYPSADYDAAIEQGSLVFETLHPLTARAGLNEMHLYSWGADRYTLPRGATAAALVGSHDGLERGDVLIFEEVRSPATGWPPGDPAHRHVVRLAEKPRTGVDAATGVPITEIRFHEEDALPFPLTVAAVIGRRPRRDITVARGNVALADHGETVTEELPIPGERAGLYAPRLSTPGVVWSQPYDHQDARGRAAAAALTQRAERTLPAVRLLERQPGEVTGSEVWRPRRDLLESSAFAQEFVVETDEAGSARLRFGDGRLGRRPLPAARFEAAYRLGGGPGGQVGAGSLAHVVEIAPDRAKSLGWLEDSAATTGTDLSAELAGFLADQPISSIAELEALWERVRGFGARLGRMPALGEAREATRFVADLEERLEALRQEARKHEVELSTDVAELIARHLRCDLETPASLLARVLRHAAATGRALDVVVARSALDQRLGIVKVRNPLPAAGGESPEPVDRARLVGPRAFRRRRSCVTEEDWRLLARRHPEVLDAVATHRCMGSWVTVLLHVHRAGGRPVDAEFRRRLRRELEPALLADRDLEIRPCVPLPLDVRLRIETDRGYVPEAVRQRILQRLGDERGSDHRGFFHSDNFRFGQTLYLADLLDEAMAVPGVLLARPLLFRPLAASGDEPVLSRIEPGPLEIVTLRRRRGSALGGVQVEIGEAA